jgi:chromate reductase
MNMNPVRMVTICGSLRKDSYNRKLRALADECLRATGAEVDSLDLREFALPIYDGDLEARGLPPEVWTLKARIAAAQGIVIASPEYNGGIPGGLKNMIDWTSRGTQQPWAGKVVGLMGATSGMWGTQRMMPHLRGVLQVLGAFVIPQQVNVREAGKLWDEGGRLMDAKLPGIVEKFVHELVRVTMRIRQEG